MRSTEPSNNDYDNDGSDNCDKIVGAFDDFGVKNYQNVTLMSRYKGQLRTWWKKYQKIWVKPYLV